MLTKLSVKNFRLLRDVSIDIEPGKPIVLIGPNGSGKSSVLQVLDMLRRWASDGLRKGFEAFGGAEAIMTPRMGTMIVEAGLVWKLESSPSIERTWSYRTQLGISTFQGTVFHIEESIRSRFHPAVKGLEREVYLSRLTNGVSIENVLTEGRDDLQAPAGSFDKLCFEFVSDQWRYPWLESIRKDFAGIHIYGGFSTTPLWARDPREGTLSPFDSAILAPAPRIEPRGLNLVNALYHLQSNHHEAWEELINAFRAEFPFVQRIEFPPDPAGGRVALFWRDQRYSNVRMQGHQMSEGMTSYLCLLAAILSPEPAAAIAFDEPDVHLHPSAMRRLVYLLEKASERTAVFVATHSDRFLDFLSDPAGSLRVCEPKDGGVTIQSLNREALDAWREKYSLAELRTRGHLDSSYESADEL
jgi:predicted ATPase